jgi:hypothetical protein
MIHLIYDVVDLYGFIHWPYPQWYSLFKNNYGALFVALSGLSVTLGRRSIRRGIQVFLGGMCCTIVTVGMYFIGLAGKGIIIYFGVLHCLGVCMILWPLFRKCPVWALPEIPLSGSFPSADVIPLGFIWLTSRCWRPCVN